MIVEQRTYTLHPGRLPQFLELVERQGLAIQTPVLGEPLGYFTVEIGELNQAVHLWGFADLADRDSRRSRLAALPQWQQFAPLVLPLIQRMRSQILKPTAFSAIL